MKKKTDPRTQKDLQLISWPRCLKRISISMARAQLQRLRKAQMTRPRERLPEGQA